MKSKLLQNNLSEDFYKDVKTFANFDLETFKRSLTILDEKLKTGHYPQSEDLLDLAQKSGQAVHLLQKCISVAYYLFSQEEMEKDSIQNILTDLVDLKKINESEAELINHKICLATPILLNTVVVKKKEERDAENTFPRLEHLHTRISVATRFEPEKDITKHTPNNYSPKLTYITPIAMVQIDVNEYGTIRRFSMGLTITELDDIIKVLQLTKVEIGILGTTISKENQLPKVELGILESTFSKENH